MSQETSELRNIGDYFFVSGFDLLYNRINYGYRNDEKYGIYLPKDFLKDLNLFMINHMKNNGYKILTKLAAPPRGENYFSVILPKGISKMIEQKYMSVNFDDGEISININSEPMFDSNSRFADFLKSSELLDTRKLNKVLEEFEKGLEIYKPKILVK